MAVQAGVIRFGASSEKVQEFAHIHPGLPQKTSQCSDLDRLVERNDATLASTAHHHMAAVLTNRLKSQALQGADDLPTGKVRELRHAPER
jgi:hypothetical protein